MFAPDMKMIFFIPSVIVVGFLGIYLTPLHPNISMHILHTVLYMFLKVLTMRICLTIKSLFYLVIILLILMTFMFDSGLIL